MGLKVIGTGLGRTGTKSLHTALTMLGFGPCHHMVEVFQHPESMSLWIDAAQGRADWEAIFRDYQAAVDYPTAAYWRELTSHYPAAKVIHTVRNADDWFDSVHATIFAPESLARRTVEDEQARFFAGILERVPRELDDRAVMTGFFQAHTRAVMATIAPQRLLVYRAGEGWEPLCRFLGVAQPAVPFPAENSRAEFLDRTQALPAAPPNA
ncbi:MAG: sulfotransferase family protein [Steroidobacteraceae bacterium]